MSNKLKHARLRCEIGLAIGVSKIINVAGVVRVVHGQMLVWHDIVSFLSFYSSGHLKSGTFVRGASTKPKAWPDPGYGVSKT